jgi:hypothetical protein
MTRNVAKASNVAQQRQTMNSSVLQIMNDDEKRCEGFKRCAARQTMNNSVLQIMDDDEKRCEGLKRCVATANNEQQCPTNDER